MIAPKVLIVADNASASAGGEAFIPLQYFKFFREMGVEVHLLAHARWQKELEKLLPKEIERLHFVRDSAINIWCYRIGQIIRSQRLALFTVGAISHFDTKVRQRRLAQFLIKRHSFDIVHEPTPVSPKMPSIMFGMSAPVVIGPMNGGINFPPNYELDRGVERFVMYILKLSSPFWNALIPGKPSAKLLLVANMRTHRAFPPFLRRKQIRELVENGVDLELFKPRPYHAPREKAVIIYVGALIDWKRVDLLIAACACLIGKLDFQVHIVGDGPERIVLERQVEKLSLTPRVRMHGQLNHCAVADLLRKSDMMVHPAMRECGGAAILEAMASGIPVIAADWGGPSDYIDANSGILIPPNTPDTFVRELASAILMLSKNRQIREKLGKAARRRAQELYDWRVKAKVMLQIYSDVLSEPQESSNRKPARASPALGPPQPAA